MGSFLLFLNIVCACVNSAFVGSGLTTPYVGIPLIGFNIFMGMVVHFTAKQS